MHLTVETEPYTRQQRNDHGTRKVERNHAERRHDRKQAKPFVAWDGEGYNDADGNHFYSLFGNSLGARVQKASLTWRDCVRLLLASPKGANHVIFAGTYDVVMMFKDTPIAARLMQGQPIRFDGYRILFRKGKYLQVTNLAIKGSTRTLYDVFSFFRTSFVKTCREYDVGDDKTLQAIEDMKGQRNDFTEISPAISAYMANELDLLVKLCDSLRDRLALCNIYPAQWHGPGAIASAVLRLHKIGPCKGKYSAEFRECAEAAYYGGRFEQFQRGTHLGPVYQYDIRSAYPAAMTLLPDLSNVAWTHYTKGTRVHNDYALYKVCTRDVDDAGIGTIPHRNRLGTIYYPSWASGWYWGIECSHVPLSRRVESWYPSGSGLTSRPFAFVADAYRQRAILKAANQPQQLAMKLMLNSLYGKLAQSKGARLDKDTGEWTYPAFHEIVWAGWITAYTRSLISDAMHSVAPGAIIACETDSVFSTVSIDGLPLSDSLGDWELQVADGIRYIQSGVSLILSDGEWSFKTRGFTVKRTTDEVAAWTKFLATDDPVMVIRQTRFGTDPRIKRTFGKWYIMDRQLSLEHGALEKRMHVPCSTCRAGLTYSDALHTMVVSPIKFGESVPYKFAWRMDGVKMLGDVLFDYEDDPVLSMEYMI